MKVVFTFGAKNSKITYIQNINIRVYHSSLDFRGTTSIQINKDEWDFKNNKIIDVTKGKRSHERTSYLLNVKNKLERIASSFEIRFLNFVVEYDIKTLPTREWSLWCRSILDEQTKSIDSESPDNSILKKFKQYIEQHKYSWASNTLKGYNSNLKVLNAFMDFDYLVEHFDVGQEEALKLWYKREYGPKLSKDYLCTELDLNFYHLFEEWCKLRGFKDNYRGSVIQKIKAVIKYFATSDEGFKFHPNINHPAFKTVKKEVDHEILTPNEIEMLKDFKGADYLENTRDLMLIQYYTAMRFSELKSELSKDLSQLKLFLRTVIKDNEPTEVLHWEIKQQKTDKFKTIPVHSVVENILSTKYPRIISSQRYNSFIKELLSVSGILKKDISSHTMRRSFCTNMYNGGQNILDILQYSGHHTEDELRKYIQVKNVNRDNSIPLI
jgi:site-specific recombinase XerD